MNIPNGIGVLMIRSKLVKLSTNPAKATNRIYLIYSLIFLEIMQYYFTLVKTIVS